MAEEREREAVTKEREKQLRNSVSLFLKVVGKKKGFNTVCLGALNRYVADF